MNVTGTWLDEATGLVHAAEAEGVRSNADGPPSASGGIATLCGLYVPVLRIRDHPPVTCALCIDANWINERTRELGKVTA